MKQTDASVPVRCCPAVRCAGSGILPLGHFPGVLTRDFALPPRPHLSCTIVCIEADRNPVLEQVLWKKQKPEAVKPLRGNVILSISNICRAKMKVETDHFRRDMSSSSLIQTILSVWNFTKSARRFADCTAGRESHPAPKNLFNCKAHYSRVKRQSARLNTNLYRLYDNPCKEEAPAPVLVLPGRCPGQVSGGGFPSGKKNLPESSRTLHVL